jgi:lipopolysaccharide/colanic/teichoic acid biosynthesis glycosyltransferase
MIKTHQPFRAQELGRRTLDIVLSCAALALFAPVMCLIVPAICLESGGPIIFSQSRLGQHGKTFRIYKFRKFRKNCGSTGPALCLDLDERLTKVGAFLRRTKLDELPQFWNVLKGDMSIVGPRPESVVFADCFSGPLRGVLAYKPGILGPSQVIFRNEGSFYPADTDPSEFYKIVLFPIKAHMDLQYYRHRSFRSDIAWIARGLLAIVTSFPLADRFVGPTPASLDVLSSQYAMLKERE